MRRAMIAGAMGIGALPALAQTTHVDICRATTACAVVGTCQPSDFEFRFTRVEEPDGTKRDIVDIQGSAPMEATTETSSQGFTFSNEKRVYTLLYLLNDAFPEGTDPEFALIDADTDGRLGAVTLYTGTCEALS